MIKVKKDKDIVIVYHKNCLDGFASAWSAWLKFKNKAIYLASEYPAGNPAINDLTGRTIFFLDFGYSSSEKIKQLVQKNQKVILIDHHLSQKPLKSLYSQAIYNEKHSSATLSWRHFHSFKPVPKLLKYIEDIDLWRFKLAYTRELTAALETYKLDFSVWQKISRDFQLAKTRKKYLEQGKSIIKDRQKTIERLAYYAEKVFFAGYPALAVNSPTLVSEVGNLLAQKNKTFAIIWHWKKSGLEVSLRSTGKIDVAEIAQKYGGGGHRAASGFTIKAKKNLKFPWKKIK